MIGAHHVVVKADEGVNLPLTVYLSVTAPLPTLSHLHTLEAVALRVQDLSHVKTLGIGNSGPGAILLEGFGCIPADLRFSPLPMLIIALVEAVLPVDHACLNGIVKGAIDLLCFALEHTIVQRVTTGSLAGYIGKKKSEQRKFHD